ncbi:hypothetical protein C5167_044368 [Papaver somniferum]|uniref:Uncharacterized protein n=1 Tax=Papaver somniferum TaxID=3469 RepID=A0A4Y7LAW5_PAPSO|nr:hypothetical protein C5167_044368 [Papaver somniferum]
MGIAVEVVKEMVQDRSEQCRCSGSGCSYEAVVVEVEMKNEKVMLKLLPSSFPQSCERLYVGFAEWNAGHWPRMEGSIKLRLVEEEKPELPANKESSSLPRFYMGISKL